MGHIKADINMQSVTPDAIEANIIRCPDWEIAKEMISYVEQIKAAGDSIGGVIRCVIRNTPVGLGEPVFDKLNADLGKAMLSINAVKGFEIGSGFSGVLLPGSQHNDPFVMQEGGVRTSSNYAGGILGGISSGEDIYCRIAFKSVSTINKEQDTVNLNNEEVKVRGEGRHDPCVLPRAVPVVDAMAALVIMDHYLRHQARKP